MKFGAALRARRKQRGKTLGELARHLGVQISYLSDVERCVRAPLNPDRIKLAAAFLDAPVASLLVLADNERGGPTAERVREQERARIVALLEERAERAGSYDERDAFLEAIEIVKVLP